MLQDAMIGLGGVRVRVHGRSPNRLGSPIPPQCDEQTVSDRQLAPQADVGHFATMTPLAWLIAFVLPACGAAGAGGLPTPALLDMSHIQRPASPNTALAAPAGTDPAPDIVTPAFPVAPPRLYDAVLAVAAEQPRTFLAAAYPAQRQVHFVARSAWFNFPDLVTAQIGDGGTRNQYARAIFAQCVWPFRPGRESPARDRMACGVADQDQPSQREIVVDARYPILPAGRVAAVQTVLPLRGEMVRLGPAGLDPRAPPAAGRHDGDPELLESRVLQLAAGQGLHRVLGAAVHLPPHAKRLHAGVLRDCRGVHRGRGVFHLSVPMAADPLASLADRALSG